MIGYPPTEELYLGCECMDLDHVALFIYFPPSEEDSKSVIEDIDDLPTIFLSVSTRNYFEEVLPPIIYFYDKTAWQTFFYNNWYKRLWFAGRYIVNPTYLREFGILDAFDFQNKDLDKLDAFLALISSDIDDNIKENSELWLDDDRWAIRFQPTRLTFKNDDTEQPWQLGWEPHFKQRGFFGRIRYAFKYIFGIHSPEKNFTLYEKDAAKMRGMIKWVQEENFALLKKEASKIEGMTEWMQNINKKDEENDK